MYSSRMDVQVAYGFYTVSFSHFISTLAKFYQGNRHLKAGFRSRRGYLVQLFASTGCYASYRRITELVRLTREITNYGIELGHLKDYGEADILSAARGTLFLKKTGDPEEKQRRRNEFFDLLQDKRLEMMEALAASMARNRQAARRSRKKRKARKKA